MKRLLPLIIVIFVLLAVLIGLIIYYVARPAAPPEPTPTPVPSPTVDPHEGEIYVRAGSDGYMWVPEAEDMPVFGREATDFNVQDQMPSYAGEDLTMRRGVDVSDHQKEIDWQAVADSGVDFAVIRCGYRSYAEGELYEDSRFRANIQGALDAGLDVGVYFFSQALNIVEAAEEAIYTIHLIEDYDVRLPVFFDWEPLPYEGSRTADVPGEAVTAACLEFTRLVRAAGYLPGMYSYLTLAYFTYDLNQLTDLSLWMGDPGTKPIFYYDHDFWQYSYTGSVPGISVDVDLDAMYIKANEPPPIAPSPSPSPEPSASPEPAAG